MSKTRATSAQSRKLQARKASAKRWNLPNQEAIAADYAEQRIAEYIEKILDDAPPLSEEQRTKPLNCCGPRVDASRPAAYRGGEALFEPADTAPNA